MPPRDADAQATAGNLVTRIDDVLADVGGPAPERSPRSPLAALARRAMTRTPAPPGDIVHVKVADEVPDFRPYDGDRQQPLNMGAPAHRIDHWDAYVCRFDPDAEDARPFP